MIVTISDNLFLPHQKSAGCGEENKNIGPTNFEWKYADPQSARFVTDMSVKKARGHGQIALLLEPYFLHPDNYIYVMRKHFAVVLTYYKSFCENLGWLWYPFGGSRIREWGIRPKTKNISIIVSDKNTMPGHKLRKMFARTYCEKVDVFQNFPAKTEALAPYRYSVVIESEKSDHYFTEKLIDCFSVGTIPIYWGSNVDKWFDMDGIVYFDDAKDIEVYDEAYYQARINSVHANYEKAKKYRICEDWIFENYPHLFGGLS